MRSVHAAYAGVIAAIAVHTSWGQCPPRWQPGSGVPGIDGLVFDARSWDPDGPGPLPALLVVAGNYSLAGGALVEDVAAWDGTAWSGVGGGVGLNVAHEVAALGEFNGELIAAGGFSSAGAGSAGGPVAVSNIARFDGVSWKPLGAGTSTFVAALGRYKSDLIAGGFFDSAGGVTAHRIARWDGIAWSPVGTGVFGSVTALAEFQDELIAAGSFSTAGGVPAGRIARWNGSVWQPLGLGLGTAGTNVVALEVYQGQLYAGGAFGTAGLVGVSNIARWDGLAWSGVGTPGPNGGVSALAVHDGELIVGGGFTSGGGVGVGSIARWNGSEWNGVGTGVAAFSPVVSALCSHGGELIAGGRFVEAGTTAVNNIARWEGPLGGGGPGWTALGGGFNDGIEALEMFAGEVIAGGVFLGVGGAETNHVARRTASGWQSVGGGTNGNVFALRTHDGSLFAGGEFSAAGGVSASRLAKWDGAAWSAVGGSGAGPNGTVMALGVYGGDLIAGGEFTGVGGVGGVGAERIARWDGVAWHALGSGVSGGNFFTTVSALGVYQGELYAGGDFTSAGGVPAPHIARWDGIEWRAVGAGVTGPTFPWVRALTEYHGRLYVGGEFTSAGGGPASNLARWDGSAWGVVGAGTALGVSALGVLGNDLVVGGFLVGLPSTSIARWNDGGGTGAGAWLPLGDGLNGGVRTVLAHDGGLSAGGFFTRSGPTVSVHYARWACDCYADCSADGSLSVADFGCFQTMFVTGDPYADCNADGVRTVADFGCFQTRFVAGCP